MSQRNIGSKAMGRSQALARDAAVDSTIGAALGLLLVSSLIASNLDMRDTLANSGEPLSSMGVVVATVVAQCAVVAGLCGAIVRKLTASD